MRFLTDLTLGKKITLLTTLGLLFGVGVFSFIGMHAVNRATETMLQDRLTTAYLVADYLDESLTRALNELKDAALQTGDDGPDGEIGTRVAALKDTYSRLSMQTHAVYFVDPKGQIIWSDSPSPAVAGTNVSAYSDMSQAMVKGIPGISGVVSAPLTDLPVVLLTSPVASGASVRGTLVVAIDPARSSIGGFVQPIRLGQTGYVEIIDQNGTVLARTEPGPKLAPFEKSDHSGRFAALISAGKPTRGVCHTCHEAETKVERKDVLAFIPLTQARWGVVLRQSEQEALAPTQELYQSLFVFGIVLVTVALGFVYVTTRDIGGRIRMLTSASQRIAGGDLTSPVITSGKDEVGMLSRALDRMRSKLQESYSELEQKTRQAEQVRSLKEVDRLRSELISSVSHELRTPLTLIKGYSTSLLRPDVSWNTQQQKEFLQIIDDKTDELRGLIDKLLQSAKLEAGALKLEKEPVLIPRLARKVVDDLTARSRKHEFALNFTPSFPVIEADARCMEQVLRNLVENAIKYSPENTRITIEGEARDGQITVSVADEGVGIAPEHQAKLFERFYRVAGPSTRGIPGSGLGLFITRGHVEAHGGKVWLESIPGKGSRFYFSLPLDA